MKHAESFTLTLQNVYRLDKYVTVTVHFFDGSNKKIRDLYWGDEVCICYELLSAFLPTDTTEEEKIEMANILP
jgi:hypothetical protein